MNEQTLRARLQAMMENTPGGVAFLSAGGDCLLGNGRGRSLAASSPVREALRDAPAAAPLHLPGVRLAPVGEQGEWVLIESAEAGDAPRRRFLRDVLHAATQGKLHLAFDASDLPPLLPLLSDAPLRADTPLGPLREAVRAAAESVGIPEDRAFGAALAAGEVAMNAVIHGGGGQVRLGCAEHTPNGPMVQVFVEDQGPGIALDELPRSALVAGYSTKDSMGMGFFLTLQEADRVFLRTGAQGTTVVVEVDRQPTPPLWLLRAGIDTIV